MRMKNEDLLKLKIDIQVKDDTNFLELAILVDNPSFLELLPLLRKEYGVSKLVGIDDFYNMTESLSDEQKYRINFSKYQNNKQLAEYVKENTIGNIDPKRLMDKFQLIDTEANLISYFFRRPQYFSEAIKHAIFCGVVDDTSYRTTSVTIVEDNRLFNSVADFQLPQVAVLISPSTTDRMAQEAIQIARTLYKTDKRLSYYKPRTDIVNKIKAYREWYWMHLTGMSYEKITESLVKSDNDDFVEFDYNRVGKSIRFYKKLLTQ